MNPNYEKSAQILAQKLAESELQSAHFQGVADDALTDAKDKQAEIETLHGQVEQLQRALDSQNTPSEGEPTQEVDDRVLEYVD